MKSVALLLCFLAAWALAQDPPRPKLSPTCSFMYHEAKTGHQEDDTFRGFYGANYTEDENQRMGVFNQTEFMNGTITSQDYSLDRMDQEKEYYINWTRGMPTDCEVTSDPYVQNIWEGFEDYYTYNGTREINGTRLEIWSFDIGGGESLEIGVSSKNRDVPVMLAEVIRYRSQVIMTVYQIKNYTTNPDKKIFAVPKICEARLINNKQSKTKKRGIRALLRAK